MCINAFRKPRKSLTLINYLPNLLFFFYLFQERSTVPIYLEGKIFFSPPPLSHSRYWRKYGQNEEIRSFSFRSQELCKGKPQNNEINEKFLI